ncbi:aldo/keto reductase [Mangrovibrevibacter kandeliae]|uniref:aldo/keto reductase n=1 Tax=Mangrovibrevibacter kandeliae TaxID=2968473 RepID=UPI00211902BE|nr:aldo/keto reductase [Aurantimonas sp. CSK15Z-1]MCQ8781466.1 aldo/keto reductase [Aurantimonas sp. CSK15Z-1]
MSNVPMLDLNDGRQMPQLGFGVWQIPDDEASEAVKTALEAGYRSIDTAMIYRNEAGVGRAIAESGVARNDLFVTTKLWNEDQGYDTTLRAFDASLERLGLEHIDLYLIHWPMPGRGLYVESWRALTELQKQGRATSIGVSNFMPEHIQAVVDATGVVPAVNQIELHPRFQQAESRRAHTALNIATESWSPLGRGRVFDDPLFVELAERYGKTTAQVILRWHIDSGLVVIPKSVTPERIRQNIDIFDFHLSDADLRRIDALDDSNGRIGSDPRTMNG